MFEIFQIWTSLTWFTCYIFCKNDFGMVFVCLVGVGV